MRILLARKVANSVGVFFNSHRAMASSNSSVINYQASCIFCKITAKEDPKTEILFEDEQFVVFRDIRPASTYHVLVVPKHHIVNANYLTSNDVELVKKMKTIGLDLLESSKLDSNDALMGFHLPPFISVRHLHLHVIALASQMSFLSRCNFRADSYWFKTVDTFLNFLSNNTS